METLIIHPRNPKESATVEAILKALDVPFHKQHEGFDPVFSGKTEGKSAGHSKKSPEDDIWKLE